MSAKYIKTDSWTYVNPSPSSPSTRLVYFYERYTVLKRFDPFFRSSSRILTTSKLKEGCSLFLFLSLFLRILRKLRELSHAAVPIRGTALLVSHPFLTDKSRYFAAQFIRFARKHFSTIILRVSRG